MSRTSTKSKEKPSKQKKETSTPAQAPVAQPGANLGTKRTCPKCSTKFYDFCKEEIHCPKCNAKLKSSQLVSVPNVPRTEPKKVKSPEKVVAEALSQDDSPPGTPSPADPFESVDDLADDDVVVDEIEVDDDDGQKTDY